MNNGEKYLTTGKKKLKYSNELKENQSKYIFIQNMIDILFRNYICKNRNINDINNLSKITFTS